MASPAKTPAREAKKAKNDAEMQCAATFDRASSEPVAVRESIERKCRGKQARFH
jgi:hypothetical protein